MRKTLLPIGSSDAKHFAVVAGWRMVPSLFYLVGRCSSQAEH